MFVERNDLDLDFAKANTFYASHRMHSFSAKFPPQLADWMIKKYSKESDYVLDPMVGSGTTLVEATLLGRNAFGCDIDPLARLISKVKATPINPLTLSQDNIEFEMKLRDCFKELRSQRKKKSSRKYLEKLGVIIPEFPNRDYWFLPEVQEELALLIFIMGQEDNKDYADFLHVVFSSIIITKGKTSVANVMDLAHSRPHYREPNEIPDVLEKFIAKLNKLARDLSGYSTSIKNSDISAKVIGVDATSIPIADNSIDLVFTSPPYVNAIDYPRAHKFSIFWLPEYLGINAVEYSQLSKEYIGTERVPKSECEKKT